MSIHNRKCWNCGHSYDTALFANECPDCQASFYDNPEYHISNSQGEHIQMNLDAIQRTEMSIQETLMQMSREAIVIPDLSETQPIRGEYIMGVDPYRVNDVNTGQQYIVHYDADGNITSTTPIQQP